MAIIQWGPTYELGIKIIDEQHKHLVDIINKLMDSFNEDMEIEASKKTIDELESYAITHFDTEEAYFVQFNYEKANEHKAEHQKFKNKIETLKSDLENGSLTIASDILAYLGEWFMDHEENFDRDYVECFHKHGLF